MSTNSADLGAYSLAAAKESLQSAPITPVTKKSIPRSIIPEISQDTNRYIIDAISNIYLV